MANTNTITMTLAVDSKGGVVNLQSFMREADGLKGKLNEVAASCPAVSRSITSIVTALKSMLALGGGISGIGYAVLKTNSQFENFGVQLETITGSAEKARQAMKWIETFTAKTPFELNQVTESFVLLQSVGIKAPEALKAVGNAAASMGRSLLDTTTAVISMEREVLKRYGIDFRQEADRASFVWQDRTGKMVETTVRGGQAIQRETLLSIWNDRYEGGMERFQGTFAGMWSNIKDNAAKFLRLIGEDGSFDFIKNKLKSVLAALDEFLESGRAEKWAANLSASIQKAWTVLETLGLWTYKAAKALWELRDAVGAAAAALAAYFIARTLTAITAVTDLGWTIKNLGFIVRYLAVTTLPALLSPLGLVAAAIGAITYAYLKMKEGQEAARRQTEEFQASLKGMNRELLQAGINVVEYELAMARLRKAQAAAMPSGIGGGPMSDYTRTKIEQAPGTFTPLTDAQGKYKQAVREENALLQQKSALLTQLSQTTDAAASAADSHNQAVNAQAGALKQLADQWTKVEAQLQLDLAKSGESEQMQQMIDLMWKAAELRKQFGDRPIIQRWFDLEKLKLEQAEAEKLLKLTDELKNMEVELHISGLAGKDRELAETDKWLMSQYDKYKEQQELVDRLLELHAAKRAAVEKKHAAETANKRLEAETWLSDRLRQLTLEDSEDRKAKALEEYMKRAEILGWTEELYRAFQLELTRIDDEEGGKRLAAEQHRQEELLNMHREKYDALANLAMTAINQAGGQFSGGLGMMFSGIKGYMDAQLQSDLTAMEGENPYQKELDMLQESLFIRLDMFTSAYGEELALKHGFLSQQAAVEDAWRQYNVDQEVIANQAKVNMTATAMDAIAGLFFVLGQKHKAAMVLGIAISTAAEVIRAKQATLTASMLAYASQLVAGDPTSLARAEAARAATLAMGKITVAAIIAAGALRSASVLSSGGGAATSAGMAAGGGYKYAAPVAPAAAQKEEEKPRSQVINVHVYGNIVDHDAFARELVPAIQKAQEDNVR